MKLLREPLVHFVLIGAGLFLLFAIVSPDDIDNRIVIDEYDLNEIIAKWNLQWQRDPTEAELKGLLDSYIQEEIYYREALAMNLDHNDEIIRRRMSQKIQFLTQDIAEGAEPDEATLQQFLVDNRENYMAEKRVSFEHVYFSPDKHADAESDASKALLGNPESGDRSPVRNEFDKITASRLRSELGQEFVDALFQLEPNAAWQGPVRSGFGYHLVRITEMEPERPYALAEVREVVVNDFKYEMQQRINEELFQGLLEKYEVVLDFEGADAEWTGK